MRLQLQDNMETLANQMHGLEDEARLSMQGFLPSLNTMSSHSSELGSPNSELLSPASILKMKKISPRETAATSFDSPEKDLSAGISEDEGGSDEDKFFDAPEVSAEELNKADQPFLPTSKQESFSVGHRRSISTASVNDTTSMRYTSDANVKEKPPQISSDRRMSVSLTNFYFFRFYIYLWFYRFPLVLPLASLRLHQP